jgi:hypothetical protein
MVCKRRGAPLFVKLRQRAAGRNTPSVRSVGSMWPSDLYLPVMDITLPKLLEQAWARALPGREAAAQNEVLRAFQHVRLRANRTLNRHRRMIESDVVDGARSQQRGAIG